MNRTRLLLFSVSLVCAAGAAQAADWPQWRGPQRTGISVETGLLKAWPAAGPKLLWQVKELGAGYSTPAVVGECLYLLNNRGLDEEFVQALGVADGKVIWTVPLGKVGNPNQQPPYPGARSTPTVVGDVLYALSSDGDLACLETTSGKVRWKKSLRAQFGGQPGEWAYSESPLVDGDLLVTAPGGPGSALVALNRHTGELVWKSAVPGNEKAAYSSPVVVETGGVRQYVTFLDKGIVGVEAKTGRFLWRYDQTARNSPANIPTPIAHDGYVYSSTGRGGGGLVRLKVDGEKVTVEPIYAATRLPSSIGGSVLVNGYLYGTTSAGLMCVEFTTGTVKWHERGVGAGSVAYADGNLYVHGENGQVALVEATPEAYREKGRFTPPGQPDRGRSQAWAYPAIANGRLYIHDFGTLWCYDVREARGAP